MPWKLYNDKCSYYRHSTGTLKLGISIASSGAAFSVAVCISASKGLTPGLAEAGLPENDLGLPGPVSFETVELR